MRSLVRTVRSLFVASSLVAVAALPAQAALVNTYGPVDDVWAAPISTGHFLFDARGMYLLPPTPSAANPSQLMLPTASLVYGVAPNTEIGLWGQYLFNGLGTSYASQGLNLLNPYLKYQLPMSLGATTFGLVAGAQIPTQAGMAHNVAMEGVASIPFTHAVSLDLGLGVGRDMVLSATLEHANAALYATLPSGQTLLAETYAYFSDSASTVYGQHVGLLLPVTSNVTTDISLAIGESSAGFSGYMPQLGVTLSM